MLFRFIQTPGSQQGRWTLLWLAVALGLCLRAKLYVPAVTFMVVVGFLVWVLVWERAPLAEPAPAPAPPPREDQRRRNRRNPKSGGVPPPSPPRSKRAWDPMLERRIGGAAAPVGGGAAIWWTWGVAPQCSSVWV